MDSRCPWKRASLSASSFATSDNPGAFGGRTSWRFGRVPAARASIAGLVLCASLDSAAAVGPSRRPMSRRPCWGRTRRALGHHRGVDREQLLAAFKRDQVEPASLSRPFRWELALGFCELYETEGLIRDGCAPPLWKCCPHVEDCWRAAWDALPMASAEDGAISLPWIGPEYRPGGVVIVGINFNDANGLTRAFEIAPQDRAELADGRRRVTYG